MEKVTVAATFKHRVIFADICDLAGSSWRSISTSIDILFRTVLKGSTCNNMLTLMPWNVPKITNSFANNMIGSHYIMFAIQLQSQARRLIRSTRVIELISEIINSKQPLGAHKRNVSSHWQSCLPVFAEVFTFTSSNPNSTK